MIDKERAIEILDEYLRLEFVVDPMWVGYRASRVVIEEGTYWWNLHRCKKGKENDPDAVGQIGGHTYYLTKNTGEIYELGLFQAGDWKREFTQFMKGEIPSFDWEPARNVYRDCQLNEEFDYEFNVRIEEISFDGREEETQGILIALLASQSESSIFKPRFKYQAVDGIVSRLRLSNFGEMTGGEIEGIYKKQIVSLSFKGGYDKLNDAHAEVKKWLRVNGFAPTDNHWVELDKIETEKNDFKEWLLKMKMEAVPQKESTV